MPLLGSAGLFDTAVNSGTNDTARSEESVASSNVVIPVDQLGTSQSVPDLTPAPTRNTMADQLESIKQQALQIQGVLNSRKEAKASGGGTDMTVEDSSTPDFRSQIQSGLVDLFNRDIAGESMAIREGYGLAEKEKLSRDLYNDATAIKRDYEAQIRELKKNEEGKLRGALQAEVNDLTEKGNLILSEKMFQYSIANGDFQQAEKLALQAISDLEKADQRRLQILNTAWDFVQNDLSESEKIQIQQNFEAQQAERNFERDQLLAEFNYNLGAGQRAFDNQMSINRQNLAEQEFLSSLNTVIDRGDGNKQLINKVTGEVIATYGEGEMEGVQPFTNPAQVQQAEAGIATIESLTAHKGLDKATGSWWGARFTPLKADVMTGEVADFIGSVDQLTKDLTLDKLISSKAEGATFGALSNEELRLLADSATKINSWRRVDEAGNTTHYKISDAKMKAELDKINNYRKLDYVLKGGDPASVGVTVTDDGKYWAKNSDGSMAEIIRISDDQ